MILGVFSSLWAAPIGALAARHPLVAVPAALLATQTWTAGWATLNLAVFATAAAANAVRRTSKVGG